MATAGAVGRAAGRSRARLGRGLNAKEQWRAGGGAGPGAGLGTGAVRPGVLALGRSAPPRTRPGSARLRPGPPAPLRLSQAARAE